MPVNQRCKEMPPNLKDWTSRDASAPPPEHPGIVSVRSGRRYLRGFVRVLAHLEDWSTELQIKEARMLLL